MDTVVTPIGYEHFCIISLKGNQIFVDSMSMQSLLFFFFVGWDCKRPHFRRHFISQSSDFPVISQVFILTSLIQTDSDVSFDKY